MLAILLFSSPSKAQQLKENTIGVYAGVNVLYPSSNVASFGPYFVYTVAPDASTFMGHLYMNIGINNTNRIARNLWAQSALEYSENIVDMGISEPNNGSRYYQSTVKFHEFHLQARGLFMAGRISFGAGPLLAYRFPSDQGKFNLPESAVIESFKSLVLMISGVVEVDLNVLRLSLEYRRSAGGLSESFAYDGDSVPFRVNSEQYLFKISRSIISY